MNDFSFPLSIWQTSVFILLSAIAFYIIKLYKREIKYLDKNSK